MADYEENLDRDTVTLYLDNDEELVCDVIAIFPARETEYIALLPQNKEDAPVYLYRFLQNPEDEDDIKLENIETDEEFDEVSAAFDQYMEDEEMLDALEDDEAEV